MANLLDGIRVIDAANFIAGPVSTTVMADIYRVRGAGYPASAYNPAAAAAARKVQHVPREHPLEARYTAARGARSRA